MRMRRVAISTSLILLCIVIGTVIAVLYAQGYQFIAPKNGKFLQGTGLLALTSVPKGARVYVNDHLTTATDNTINLEPGTYTIKIEKDGYYSWSKSISIKEKEVSQASALLFPNTPKLEPLTNTGIMNTLADETGTLLAYTVASSSARKNGVYLLNMSSRPILPIGGLATQLADDTQESFSLSHLTFSPDGDQILASISATLGTTTYLLSTKGYNNNPQDISSTLAQTDLDWKELQELKRERTVNSLPRALRTPAQKYFSDIKIGPEEDKVLYTASESAVLDIVKKPAVVGANSTPEQRKLEKGNVYVYDIKEDRNYLIYKKDAASTKAVPNFIWHPDSKHLIYTEDNRINIMEFDAQNKTTLYAGPFEKGFVSVWPDGSNLVILTNFNIPGAAYNLYRISLK